MSPSVQRLPVRMSRCSFHADSDRDESPSMSCKSAIRDGMGSILFGIDPLNSCLAGMPHRLLRLYYVAYSVFVIMLQFYILTYQSMTITIVC